MSRKLLAAAAGLGLFVSAPAVAVGANPHTTSPTGQPNQSCQDFSTTNEPGGPNHGMNQPQFLNIATLAYAGAQPQNSNNPQSVSQYDVSCFQVH